MGLDMYLFRKINGKLEELGYWRKANQIHNWFVVNVQNGIDECQESPVSKEQLKSLLSTVNKVLKSPETSTRLLPTQGGFFFGSTDYDTYYIQDLKETQKILRKAIKAEGQIFYQSSW